MFRRFPCNLRTLRLVVPLAECLLGLIAGGISTPLVAQEVADTARQFVARSVLPSATDSRIDKFSGNGWEHWVYFDPAAADRHLLVVFLPGTGGKGSGAKAFCTLAASEGFHVVSLTYPSDVSMSEFHASADPDAFLKARENIIYGKPRFEKLDTGVPNSIQNRLAQLLRYLADNYRHERWRQFLLPNGDLDYSKLVLAGQSQGGGHAALMAMQHEVARVLMFGAPKDFNVHFDKPARWYSGNSATPLGRFFSFVHSQDEGHGCTYPQQLENYRALGLMPKYEVVSVDDTPAPYRHSRLLTSDRPAKSPHGAPISNKVYQEAWKYMLEEPAP